MIQAKRLCNLACADWEYGRNVLVEGDYAEGGFNTKVGNQSSRRNSTELDSELRDQIVSMSFVFSLAGMANGNVSYWELRNWTALSETGRKAAIGAALNERQLLGSSRENRNNRN